MYYGSREAGFMSADLVDLASGIQLAVGDIPWSTTCSRLLKIQFNLRSVIHPYRKKKKTGRYIGYQVGHLL